MIRRTAITTTAITTTDGVQDRSTIRIGGLATLASLGSLFYYAQRGELLMHGDATAHINIARRVFDSLTPGPLQLGTVWLPLPHLLMMPFIYSDKLWQSGVGGSIPSMCAYVLGVLGIVRLVGGLLESEAGTRPAAQVGAWIAAFAYGANPNLIYTQATALTEPLYLAFFIWAMVYFAEFVRALGPRAPETDVPETDVPETDVPENGAPEERRDEVMSGAATRALRRCAFCVACAEMTRYDGWFLAGALGAIAIAIALRRRGNRTLRWSALKFLAGIAVLPTLWLIYNAVVYGNALDFANGPYSAKAIELRVAAPNPAFHSFWLGGLYFLKSAQITLAVGNWGRWWLAAAMFATCAALYVLRSRAAAVVVLLWAPLPFYAYSISYGWVPLHVPMWWPHAVFNQRFGLELLPMFAVSAGLLAAYVKVACAKIWSRSAPALIAAWSTTAVVIALVAVSYAFVLKAQPLCLVESERNWNMRRGLDTSIERLIKPLPPGSIFMMDLGEHVGIMERLGIPLRRVVNGENHRPWMRPADPEGIWERALADPGKYVDYVIAFEGDPVDRYVNRTNLTLWTVIHSTGQPVAKIYETRRAMNQSR